MEAETKNPRGGQTSSTTLTLRFRSREKKGKMIARKAAEEEKSNLWPLLTKMYPAYNDYQRGTKREIPVVILTMDNA